MAKTTLLTQAIQGRPVLAYVNGQYTTRKGSNLHAAIIAQGYAPEDIGVKIDVAVGAKRQHRTEGYRMAIVRL